MNGKMRGTIDLAIDAIESTAVAEALKIATVQQEFYENNCSFIVCEMTDAVEDVFEKEDLLEMMNVTPTESEAWDIVQMEEIERELLGDFEDE